MAISRKELYYTDVHGERPYFVISKAPTPFRLVSEEVKSYEKFGNRFVVDLTILPVFLGEEMLGHKRRFEIPFESALHGATNSLGTGVGQSLNVRLLGRFNFTNEQGFLPDEHEKSCRAYEAMIEYQWEAVFTTRSPVIGFVLRLKESLPKTWTL